MARFIRNGDGIEFEYNLGDKPGKEIANKIRKKCGGTIETSGEKSHILIEKADISKAVKTVFCLYVQACNNEKNPSSATNTLFNSELTEEEKDGFNATKENLKTIMTSLKECILNLADSNNLTADLTTKLSTYHQKALVPKTGVRRLPGLFSLYESSGDKYKIISNKITSKEFGSNQKLLEAVMNTLIENPSIADVRLWSKSTTVQHLLDIINNVITAETDTKVQPQQH